MFFLLVISAHQSESQEGSMKKDIDTKAGTFLEKQQGTWRDMNVPESDGKTLHDIIVKNNYTKALEIGTSTGHSGIWIARALNKTGGRLITIEIDEGRHKQAVENFAKAGVSGFIDARLGDAHVLAPEIEGTFDFIFVDADKGWYRNYLELLLPKLEEGGCFAAHNVLNTNMTGIVEFMAYLKSLPELETTVDRSSGSGVSVSYKKVVKRKK